MENLAVGRWVIEHDSAATEEVYRAASGGAHECSCPSCRNFIEVRDRAYPPAFLSLLGTLGIDPHKEAEIAELGPEGTGRLYQGWYHFIGRVLEDPENHLVFRADGAEWSVFFSEGRSLAHDEFGDHPLVQLDWSVVLPWLLGNPPT